MKVKNAKHVLAALLAAGVALVVRSEVPDLANAAVTDLNPGVMMPLTQLEVEGEAPYIFHVAKPGTCYFVGRVNGEEKSTQLGRYFVPGIFGYITSLTSVEGQSDWFTATILDRFLSHLDTPLKRARLSQSTPHGPSSAVCSQLPQISCVSTYLIRLHTQK